MNNILDETLVLATKIISVGTSLLVVTIDIVWKVKWCHSGLERIQEKKKVTKDLSMVLKPFGPTNFKMLKQKIRTWDLFAKMYFFLQKNTLKFDF